MRMINKKSATIAATIILSTISTNMVSAKSNCEDPQTQTEMNLCSKADYQSADKILNQTYNRHIQSLDKIQKQALQNAQRAWITYRDQACHSFSLTAQGGSIQPLIHNNCLTRLTNERTQLLNDQFPEQ